MPVQPPINWSSGLKNFCRGDHSRRYKFASIVKIRFVIYLPSIFVGWILSATAPSLSYYLGILNNFLTQSHSSHLPHLDAGSTTDSSFHGAISRFLDASNGIWEPWETVCLFIASVQIESVSRVTEKICSENSVSKHGLTHQASAVGCTIIKTCRLVL